MKFTVLIHDAEEGGFWAEVPALPGCVSQGDSLDELIANVKEAVEGYLAEPDNLHIPDSNTRIVEIAV